MLKLLLSTRFWMGLFLFMGLLVELTSQKLDYVQGELLVVMEDNFGIDQLTKDLAVFENARTQAVTQKLKTNPFSMWRVKFDHNVISDLRYLDNIRSLRGVKMAQFNHLIEYRNIPDDPQFPNQWQYLADGTNGAVEGADIDMDLAWDITTGGLTMNGDTIVACVIDGGMDPSHEDFGDNLWKNWAEIPNNGIDDDNNGYVDDFNGWSAYENNDDVFKGGSHGTPVAGIIGAQGNNGIGVAGVNWDVKLMIVRGGGNEAAALEAYAYPYALRKRYNETNGEEGAFVVATNASWGTDLLHWEDAPIWCSFYDSLGMAGILNCGATANANYNIDEQGDMPTSCPSNYLISVTNMANDDNKVSGAGYGIETIDLGAFGAGTWTTAWNNGYGGFGGTSGATPHVTGVVALAYSTSCDILADLAITDPGQAALLIKEFILKGVKPNESLVGKTVTGGKLNANNSLLLLDNFCGDCPFPVSVTIENQSTSMASLIWTVPVDSMFFDMVFREAGMTDWDTLFNVQSPVVLDGLYSCTKYEFKIKTRCTEDQGSYSFIYTFETDGCCTLPPSHQVIFENDIVVIELEDILATDTYTLEYKVFGSPEWYSITLDTNVFVLPDPGDCSVYFYRYRSDCLGQDLSFSDVYNTSGHCEDCTAQQLCEAEGNNFFEFIDTLQIGDFVNASGRDENGYGNYTFANSVEMTLGQNYVFRLVPGFNENKFDEYVKVYIDYNANGSFEDTELVLDLFTADGDIVEDLIEVPKEIVTGFSKIRVIMSFQSISNPCSSLTYGEIEDYCIYLNGDVSECLLGDYLIDTLDITSSTVMLGWNNPEGLIEFLYRYRKQGEEIWTSATTTDTLLTIENLDSCAVYEFELQGNCIDGTSQYTDTYVFETDCINAIHDDPLVLSNVPRCYPNPFKDELIVQLPNKIVGPVTVSILTASGNQVLQLKDIYTDSSNSIKLTGLQNYLDKSTVLLLKINTGLGSHVMKMMYMP